MPTTRLYLARHGATQLTAEGRFAGSVGVELSEEGRWQAAQLGERLRHESITAAYSSPLSRAADTAAIVTAACGLAAATRDGLREISHGNVVHRFEKRPVAINEDDCPLTDRELEILRLVSEGHTNGRIARELWVTEQTVKFHLSNTYRKLGVANRTEASRYAHLHNLTAPRERLAS